MVTVKIYLTIFIFTTIHGQQCPQNYKNMDNLNMARFAKGRWFLYKSNNFYGIHIASCTYVTFKNETVPKMAVNFHYAFENRYQVIPYSSKNQNAFDFNITIPFLLNSNYTLSMKVRDWIIFY